MDRGHQDDDRGIIEKVDVSLMASHDPMTYTRGSKGDLRSGDDEPPRR